MKISTSKENLIKGIQVVQNVVSGKTTLPILSHILIEGKKNKIRLTATDLEIGMSIEIDGEVVEEGAITIPARKFGEIIKELPSLGLINISLKKGQSVQIESGKSYFRIMGLPKEDFPQLPEFSTSGKNIDIAKIPQKVLKRMIGLTSFAMSHDDTRYVLNGILFSFKDKTLKLAATDGRRLALIEEKMEGMGGIKKDVILPMKTIQELGRNLLDDGEVNFYFKENQLQINLGNTTITSRLIEGEYPNYEQVIPKKIKEEIIINTQDFLQSTRRASILTSQDSQSIKLNFTKDRAIITKNAPELGEVREEIEVNYKGGEFVIGFNPLFLIDVLKSVDEAEIKFGFTDSDKPAMIKCGNNYTYIVLPMQVA